MSPRLVPLTGVLLVGGGYRSGLESRSLVVATIEQRDAGRDPRLVAQPVGAQRPSRMSRVSRPDRSKVS
jgi:hypothetical protein